MTRGRKPLPQELLNLRGTDRRDRLRPTSTIGELIKVEEVGDKCQISGLRGASSRARKIYWSLVKRVAVQGMLEEAFLSQLLFYAVEYDHFITCCEDIRKNGSVLILEDKKGNPVVAANPAVHQRDNALDRLLKIGSNFGFSPVDRQRLKIPQEDPKAKGVKAIIAMLYGNVEDEADEQ